LNPLFAAGGPFNPSTFKKSVEPENIPNMPSATASIEFLHQDYQNEMKSLIAKGVSPLSASQEAFKRFSEEEAISIQTFILEASKNKSTQIPSSTPPELKQGCSKMNTIRTNNNREQEHLLTIDEPTLVDNSTDNPKPS